MLNLIRKKTYLEMIKNSPGTSLFRSYFVESHNKTVDIYQNGKKSCAAFVSSILYLNNLIDTPHGTVKSTREKMIESGWKQVNVKDIKFGDIIIWEKIKIGKDANKHIGFVLNKNQAISNNHHRKQIIKHQINYNNKRKIEEAFRFDFKTKNNRS